MVLTEFSNDIVLLQEIEDLISIYFSLGMEGHPYSAKTNGWLESAVHLGRQISEKKIGTFEDEMHLENLSMQLRVLWMEFVQFTTNKHMKSPPLGEVKYLPSQNKIDFSYERNIEPVHLERKANLYREKHDEWECDHVFASSGMACISTFLQSFFGMSKPTQKQPLKLCTWGDYFETRVLLDLYKRDSIEIQNFKTQKEFEASISRFDLFFIEPVRYNWSLEVFNFVSFIDKLTKDTSKNLKVLIIDTTLNGNTLRVIELLEKLKAIPNLIFVHIHSCLKLDQQGMEFSNCGLLSVYTVKENNQIPSAKNICSYIRKVRTLLGTGLTYEEISLLDNKFFLNRKGFSIYCNRVFKNNEDLAKSICNKGIFNNIAYPSLISTESWAKAPFVVFHLKEDTLENYGWLLSIVNYEAKRKKIPFVMGSSFGFRTHRFEVIIPNLKQGKGLFKVAMGVREGPTKEYVINLLMIISKYKNLEELKLAYPKVTPINLKDIKA
ncbi:hypothetical protein [Bacillus thuringiensis]|uniref:hypothetical protein n=1 Tax=Bacillus thuringiensis TaxID=1428 RepID=UPI000BF252B7|nr:hypothetical protein [Bacillus thuringiensis]PFW22302.1 hypothetical protein COL19_18835 [Bacillus thuringiensis]